MERLEFETIDKLLAVVGIALVIWAIALFYLLVIRRKKPNHLDLDFTEFLKPAPKEQEKPKKSRPVRV